MTENEESAVCVLDASALINCKHRIPSAKQWDFFIHMRALVDRGRVAFPRQVVKECTGQKHTDVPEAWIQAAQNGLQFPLDGYWAEAAEVLSHARGLIDPDAEQEQADPYVVGMALYLRRRGWQARVVSDDDAEWKVSVREACNIMNLPCLTLQSFLSWSEWKG